MSLPKAVQETDAWDKSKARVGAAHGTKAPTYYRAFGGWARREVELQRARKVWH